jgi:beta-mannosidase
VKYETEKIIKRLRNHASLVMWCGSNETLWEKNYGGVLFYVTIRDICEKLDPTRVYWFSSPFGGYWPNSPSEGNEHNWYVWLGFKPYRSYAEDTACFVSEFGMQAVPHLKTWQSCFSGDQLSAKSIQNEMKSETPPGDRPSLSKTCTDFQYHGFQTNRFLQYSKEFGDIQTVEQLVHVTQLMQATSVKYAVEHFRRRKFKCGGTLFWQLNDIWPTTSYSCIDYYLRPKMLYYFAKRFFEPVLVSFQEHNEGVSVWITNDVTKHVKGVLTVSLEKFNGEKIWLEHMDIEVKENESISVLNIPSQNLEQVNPNYVVLWGQFEYDKNIISRNYHFLSEHRQLQFPETKLLWEKKKNKHTELFISAENYARLVMIEIEDDTVILGDNYFDLCAGESRSVKLSLLYGNDLRSDQISVTAWNSKSS